MPSFEQLEFYLRQQTMNYPFYSNVPVRFRDLDSMGHVNNAVYFTYLEIARTDFFINLLDLKNAQDFPVILAEASCRYLAPAHFGETLRVGLGVARWGNKSFDFVYGLENNNGRPIATAWTVMVMYNYQKAESYSIPVEFRQQIEQFQNGWRFQEQ